METTFKNLAVALIIFVSAVSILSSCKKGGGGSTPNADKFPLTNFSVITGTTRVNGTSVFIKYDVKNVSAKDYILTDNVQHIVYIRYTIVTTDGTSYQENRSIPDLQAGRTAAEELLIQMSSGKTLDPSKTKFELYYER